MRRFVSSSRAAANRELDTALAARARQLAVGPWVSSGRKMLGREPRVSVVIPTLNEAENLPFVVPRIPVSVDEVVLVDGGSSDGTVERARALRPDVRVVEQDGIGKGAALRSGFKGCTGDIIVMLDADGSNDPAEIPLYVGALLSGADFAKGTRFVQGGGTSDMPFPRRLGNQAFVALVRLFFGGHYSDLCYGYNAFWADVPDRLALESNGFEIETAMNIRALRAHLHVVEVPSFEHRRLYGEGHLKVVSDGWRVLKTIFAERLEKRSFDAPAVAEPVGERKSVSVD